MSFQGRKTLQDAHSFLGLDQHKGVPLPLALCVLVSSFFFVWFFFTGRILFPTVSCDIVLFTPSFQI